MHFKRLFTCHVLMHARITAIHVMVMHSGKVDSKYIMITISYLGHPVSESRSFKSPPQLLL